MVGRPPFVEAGEKAELNRLGRERVANGNGNWERCKRREGKIFRMWRWIGRREGGSWVDRDTNPANLAREMIMNMPAEYRLAESDHLLGPTGWAWAVLVLAECREEPLTCRSQNWTMATGIH